MALLLCLCFCSLLACAWGGGGVRVEGRLSVNAGKGGGGGVVAPARTALTLSGPDGEQYRAFSRADGSFAFFDVLPGVYSMDVLSKEHHFSHLKVRIPEGSGEDFGLQGPIQVLEFK
jgi:hypothetical protein